MGAGPRGNYIRVAGLGTTCFGGQASVPGPPGMRADGVVMREIVDTPVQHLVAAHPSDLINQMQAAARSRRVWPWAALALAIVALVAAPYGLVLLLPGVPAVLWLRQRDLARRSVVVFYEVTDGPAANYERVAGSHGFVGRVERVWQVEAEGVLHTLYQRKVNAGAGALVRRSVGALSLAGPPVLVLAEVLNRMR